MKKIITLILAFILAFSLASCADEYAKGTVCTVCQNGDAELDVMPQKVMEKAELGGTAFVTVGDFSGEMPFVDEIIEKEGELQLYLDREEWCVRICVFGGSFCDMYGVGEGDRAAIGKNG